MNEDQNLRTVKVGNWETLFFSKLRSLFDRAEFCDLTLQFYDNSILKVHRVVLSACTDYFNMLEESCEMIDGHTLILPDDLPANVIVPIVNFMYTGTLKFHNQLFEKLLKTSREMKLSVLSKLLEFHRPAENDQSQRPRHPKAVAARPKPRVLYRQTPPMNLVPQHFVRPSNASEPASDPLEITKVERKPTSSIRVIDSAHLGVKPRRTWDARDEHILSRHVDKRIRMLKAPVPVRNVMAKRITYQNRERLVRPARPIVQQITEPIVEVKVESDLDPLSISLAQDISDTEQELPFKIESVHTMHAKSPPKRPASVAVTPQEQPKRVKKEENVLEISDDSFDGADDDFLLNLKDFSGQNVESM